MPLVSAAGPFGGTVSGDVRLAVALLLLLGAAAGALTANGVRVRRQVVTASIRAAVQLAVLGAVLGLVFRFPAAAAVVLVVMLATATRTAARRLRDFPGATRAVLTASVAGASTTLVVAFATGAVDLSVRYVVALGGITLGGTMTACTLAGRQLLAGIRTRRDEVEGWLALGATPRQAVRDIVRTAAGEALLPAIDQTRTVGLVTLPGAFVGALFGGASPGSAARFQLIVLVGLLTAEAVAAVTLTYSLGAPQPLPLPSDDRAAGGDGTVRAASRPRRVLRRRT
ncbi:MAG TPA: ABC transporter permease [Mycobacteriales bacterium]|nr:ABC transporter permease [Mycobacteriales bacterium]